MTDQKLTPTKQALLKIRELKRELLRAQETPSDHYEPIAVVSMACRFPRRSRTPELFWQSLLDKSDEVSDIPESRWDPLAFHDDDPDAPGKMYARRGVFLDDLDQMDPEFFGISPREATWVDPQQRLLMEVGWEAIERAGWVPGRIGESTGVFVGWMHNDYQNEASDSFLNLNPYIATGAAGSFLCGRLAYYLGLYGPSIAIDTACSSSLVALHLAIQSLHRRDCDRALVGGVNAICSPTTNILTCKLKALSPTGQSRAFDAAADGYVRGEGCGVVAVRRLADAQRDGDPILGIIRGSAVGHNGAGSGLTVPNPRAQELVIRQAIERANIQPDDVGYLEAHGTGTELGDPIEMNAAAAALAGNRTKDNPLLVGSVKTNIGHLEAAAGMAGLIKVLLSLQNNQLAGQLNFETPNPHIAWDALPVRVLSDAAPWPDADRRIAGVSAFGMSGTNAHVIVEAPTRDSLPPGGRVADDVQTPTIITLSAKTESALFDLAYNYAAALGHDSDVTLDALSYTTNLGRSHFEHRAAFVAEDMPSAVDKLHQLARGNSSCIAMGQTKRSSKVAWQFTGQGSQYAGMARGLFESEPVFRKAIDDCDRQLRDLRGDDVTLTAVLFNREGEAPAEPGASVDTNSGSEGASRSRSKPRTLDDTTWTQPAIFAVQMGLAKLLEYDGLQPDIVLGHSVGQYAAACVAGIMSWEDGLRLISERGRLIGALPAGGKMIAVFASASEIEAALVGHDEVSIAANNGTHVVISGPEADVERVAAAFDERGIRTKALTTSHAFHSSLMEPALAEFERFASQFKFNSPRLPLVCNVTGNVVAADATLDGAYWTRHIRQGVRYAESIDAIVADGCDVVLELGPQAILTRMAASNWTGEPAALVSCLNKGRDDLVSIGEALAQLHVHGVAPDFEALHTGRPKQLASLPTYPFQRRRFWGPDKPRAAHAEHHTAHPLLGTPVALAGVDNESRFESFVDVDSPSWLSDHELMGSVVMPGAALVELALAASSSNVVEEINFEQPLRLSSRTALQSVVRNSAEATTIETYAAATDVTKAHAAWTRHFSAQLDGKKRNHEAAGEPSATADSISGLAGSSLSPVDVNQLKSRLSRSMTSAKFYDAMHGFGLTYGPAFQTIQSLHYSDGEVLAELKAANDVRGYNVSPTILDGALHALAVWLVENNDGNFLLPAAIGRVELTTEVTGTVWAHARWRDRDEGSRTADITIYDENGSVLLLVEALRVEQVSIAALRRMSRQGPSRLMFEFDWEPTRLGQATQKPTRWLLVENKVRTGPASIQRALEQRKHTVHRVQLNSETNWQSALEVGGPFDGIAWFTEYEVDTKTNIENVLGLFDALTAAGHRQLECGFQFVTAGAVATTENALVDPAQSKYWGLARVIGAERPAYRCRVIDIPNEREGASPSRVASSTALVDILLTETVENQFAIRENQLLVPRLQSARRAAADAQPFAASADHSYLITGGLGQLGRHAAKWLADHGAGQVILVSRREPSDEAQSFIDTIGETGCEVIVHAADVSQRAGAEQLFARIEKELKPLAGIIHAAGILDDANLESQTWKRFEKVLDSKIEAARLLDEFSRELELDFFVLYSSAASVLGSPGQSNYATGNAFLDGLAFQRRAVGLPALSINWGPWSAGMADDERIMRRLQSQGIAALSIADAHAAMESLLSSGVAQATVMDVDWQRLKNGWGGVPLTLLDRLVSKKRQAGGADSALVAQLRTLDPKSQRKLLVETVQGSLQSILGTSDAPDPDRPLIEMGLDSLMAVEFGTALQQMLGGHVAVSPAMLFDHPTIDAISDHVLELIGDTTHAAAKKSDPLVASAPSDETERRGPLREDIAIIGMSCRFPGANNVDEYWQNLMNGVDSVSDIPNDRWDIERFYSGDSKHPKPGKMSTRQGGFVDRIGDFDPAFFGISEQEACWIDPQHRMLLENSHHALEDAGIVTDRMTDNRVGVFMGIMGQDYAFLPTLDDEDVIRGFQGAGLSHSAGVGRISYIFGFEGPSVAVDTASSSSLVALHQALRSLQDRNCNLALAGGVNAILAPVNSLLMSKAGLLSPDGRCKSFSANANGFGRGEGCGVVVLKRLSDAQRDGDRILAVVRGAAVMHNGTSSGITAPSGKAQGKVIEAALRDAKVAPADVHYLEAHGTGTEYGDPIELAAAAAVYGKGRKKEEPLLVGSVKANISHLEAAGGSSGLIKTVLALYHGMLPPQAHFAEPSPHIPWDRLPVKMVTEPTPLPNDSDEPFLAGITALGLVGTNAHVILQSSRHTPCTETSDTSVGNASDCEFIGTCLLPISAQTPAALQAVARSYADFLEKTTGAHHDGHASTEPESGQTHARGSAGALPSRLSPTTLVSSPFRGPDLQDICYTASAHRRHHEYRIGIVGDSRESLLEQLRSVVADGQRRTGAAPKIGWCFPDLRCISSTNREGEAPAEPKSEPTDAHRSATASLCPSMGKIARELYQTQPVVRYLFAAFDERLSEHDAPSWNFVDFCESDGQVPDTRETHDLLAYAIQAALAKTSLSFGIEPDGAVGLGVGQFVAACVAGCMCFVDAIVLVRQRAVCRDADNSEASLDQFEAIADRFNFYPPKLPLICSSAAEVIPVHKSLGGSYWRSQIAAEIDAAAPLAAFESLGCELTMDFDLCREDEAAAELEPARIVMLGSAEDSPSRGLMQALGRLYERRVPIDFAAVYAQANVRRVQLPLYPFQKKRYWITEIGKYLDDSTVGPSLREGQVPSSDFRGESAQMGTKKQLHGPSSKKGIDRASTETSL